MLFPIGMRVTGAACLQDGYLGTVPLTPTVHYIYRGMVCLLRIQLK